MNIAVVMKIVVVNMNTNMNLMNDNVRKKKVKKERNILKKKLIN